MFSQSTIRQFQRDAAERAAAQNAVPFTVWPQDLADWKRQIDSGKLPHLPFPFIGDYTPRGYRKVNDYFVDSSGWGTESEPALTVPQFIDKVQLGKAYAITEAGQFQVYVGEFEKQ